LQNAAAALHRNLDDIDPADFNMTNHELETNVLGIFSLAPSRRCAYRRLGQRVAQRRAARTGVRAPCVTLADYAEDLRPIVGRIVFIATPLWVGRDRRLPQEPPLGFRRYGTTWFVSEPRDISLAARCAESAARSLRNLSRHPGRRSQPATVFEIPWRWQTPLYGNLMRLSKG
jgi:hypothetical protein